MRKHLVAVLAAVVLLPSMVGAQTAPPNPVTTAPSKFNEMTVAQLQALMASGELSSVNLTNFYISRILQLDQNGPGVNAVIELNPDAVAMAREADRLRNKGTLHVRHLFPKATPCLVALPHSPRGCSWPSRPPPVLTATIKVSGRPPDAAEAA